MHTYLVYLSTGCEINVTADNLNYSDTTLEFVVNNQVIAEFTSFQGWIRILPGQSS